MTASGQKNYYRYFIEAHACLASIVMKDDAEVAEISKRGNVGYNPKFKRVHVTVFAFQKH